MSASLHETMHGQWIFLHLCMRLRVFAAHCGNKYSTMRLHSNSYEDIFDAIGGTLLPRGLH